MQVFIYIDGTCGRYDVNAEIRADRSGWSSPYPFAEED